MKTIIHKDVTIKTIDDWKAVAPPKDPIHQWKDGRSAKELARFTLSEDFNNVLTEVLDSLGIKKQNFEAEPEAETYFRTDLVNMGTRGPRNHDLLLIGSDCVIGIEAKVSESFGETIKKEWDNSKKGENKKHRILGLVEFISGQEFNSVEELPKDISELRYQLFTATVGTVQEAINRHFKNAVVLVIVFDGNVDKEPDYESHVSCNNRDYNRFVEKYFQNGKRSFYGVDCHIVKRVIHINPSFQVD